MENSHSSDQETVSATQDEFSTQISGETSFLSQNLDDFLAEEDASFSDDDVSVGDFDEETGIGNKDDYIQTEDADALEANNENQNKYELCSGMDFSSDESAYNAYRKYGGNHGFDVRRQRTTRKKQKASKDGLCMLKRGA